ncbi:MAG TPA: adenylate/guanylate cyclase domain-containing protein, partial [Candidatus Gastranaerophilaceae bacterium]|nr:adenylate/guanylate cyclase domain-containing protein [Candidatus Gastranaerophilaceae bacterium]
FAGFLKYMGEGGKIEVKKDKIQYKGRVIPIDEDGIVNISWHKLGRSYVYVPISRILLNHGGQRDLNPDFFKNKMVIIGKTATGSNLDMNSIIDQSFTGPEANAVALDNFINDTDPNNKQARKFVHELPKPFEILMTVIICIVVALLGLVPQSAFIGFLNGFASIIFYLSSSFWMFVNPSSRVWLPMVEPLYYLAMTAIAVFAFRLWGEMTRKASIMNVFGKFVAPKVLASVLKDPNKLVLKNTKKRITILFCDVKNFSSLCEKYPPEQLVSNLNELFKEVVNIIFANNGTVDKFIGDCIMAYWGDLTDSADEEFLAVKTALEIKKRINELKITNAQEGKIVFDVKIGINTGEAVLGLAGTDKIMSYTAMGDAVNTASRLETSCSTYKKDILISKSTYDAVQDKIIAFEIGKISVKGKEEQVEVFEPVDFA